MGEENKQINNMELRFTDNVDKLYENIVGYQVGNDVIAVLTQEGETHIFPLSDIVSIRHFPVNV